MTDLLSPGMPGLLRSLTSVPTVEQVLVLLVPGLVAVLVYDLRVPGERRKYSEIVLAVVIYSAFMDVGWLVVALLFPALPVYVYVVVFAFALPLVVGWFTVDLREWLASEGLALSPFPTAWDQLFRRLGSSKELFGIVVTLNDGRKIGGIYNSTSFVSTYPAEGDLLIGAPCDVDQTSGLFNNYIATSYGLYVKRSDILTIEIRELSVAFARRGDAGDSSESSPDGRAEDSEVDEASRRAARPAEPDPELGADDDAAGLGGPTASA